MKNLNDKSQDLNAKKKIRYGGVALIALLCASSVSQASQAMDKDDQDFPRQFLIKNAKTQKYIFVSNIDKVAGGNNAVLGTLDKSQASVFAIEKNTSGTNSIQIKNIKSNEYLFSSDYSQYCIGYKYIAANTNFNTLGHYFYIHKEDGGFVIKNKKNAEYFYLSNSWNTPDYILSSNDLYKSSYFIFEAYEPENPIPEQQVKAMKKDKQKKDKQKKDKQKFR